MTEWNHNIESEEFWPKLDQAGQVWARKSCAGIESELLVMGRSRTRCGQHLQQLYDVLHPLGCYYSYIGRRFRIARRTELRWRDIYNQSRASIPDAVLDTAMAHGIDVVTPSMAEGIEEDATPAEIMERLQNVLQMPKQQVITVEYDKRVLLGESANLWSARVKKVPKEQQEEFICAVASVVLARFKVTRTVKITPSESPKGFRQRGRPATALSA